MAGITIVITDGPEEGDVNVKATFDPVVGGEGYEYKFSLAQYLGTLCIENIANGNLARKDGLGFKNTKIVEKFDKE